MKEDAKIQSPHVISDPGASPIRVRKVEGDAYIGTTATPVETATKADEVKRLIGSRKFFSGRKTVRFIPKRSFDPKGSLHEELLYRPIRGAVSKD